MWFWLINPQLRNQKGNIGLVRFETITTLYTNSYEDIQHHIPQQRLFLYLNFYQQTAHTKTPIARHVHDF